MPITSITVNDWSLPGRNCGACGYPRCEELLAAVHVGSASYSRCPFYVPVSANHMESQVHDYSGKDIVGQEYDFVISAMPGEPSARKIVLPFRPDLVEKMGIVPGDIVTGRPAGAGCPVQHVIRVLEADEVTGVITGHVVGPAYSRDHEVKDVKEYHMLGFEGHAIPIRCEPRFGIRHSFLPGFCMMYRSHTGLVNMVLDKPWGIQVRVEGIVIL